MKQSRCRAGPVRAGERRSRRRGNPVQEQAAPLEGFLRNTIETRPYTAVAVALGLGWFIGHMSSRADY